MSIFNYSDYKDFLREEIARRSEKRGLQTQLAESAGCQRAYLSQVLRTHVQLTPDHAEGIAGALELDDAQTEYFLALVDLARAARPSLRARLERKLARLKAESQNLSKRFERDNSLRSAEQIAEYYSAWYWAAIHLLLSVSEFQTPPAIARRLGIPSTRVRRVLEGLLRMGLATHEGERWLRVPFDLHLARESPLARVNHQNWRERAVMDSHDPESQGVHYTMAFTASVADIESLKQGLLEHFALLRRRIEASPSEELAVFTCDLFKV